MMISSENPLLRGESRTAGGQTDQPTTLVCVCVCVCVLGLGLGSKWDPDETGVHVYRRLADPRGNIP